MPTRLQFETGRYGDEAWPAAGSPVNADARPPTPQAGKDQFEGKSAPMPTMRAYTPSLFDRLSEWFASDSDRARASNELFAQQRAAETGQTPDAIYRALGGHRPMVNPEGASLPRYAVKAAKVAGKQVPHIPADVANTLLRTLRGGDKTTDDSGWLDKAIKATDPSQPEFHDPNFDAFRGLGQSLGFSLANLGAFAVGSVAGNLVAPGVGTAGGVAAAGASAYRGQFDAFMDRLKNKANAEAIKRGGKPLTQAEWSKIYDHYKNAARKYGLAEAVTEPVGDMLVGGLIAKKALQGATRHGVGTRLGELFGTELATETGTQKIQNSAEVDAGLADRRIGLGEAFRQVAVPTILTTGIIGPSAAAIGQVRSVLGADAADAAARAAHAQAADKSVTNADASAPKTAARGAAQAVPESPSVAADAAIAKALRGQTLTETEKNTLETAGLAKRDTKGALRPLPRMRRRRGKSSTATRTPTRGPPLRPRRARPTNRPARRSTPIPTTPAWTTPRRSRPRWSAARMCPPTCWSTIPI